MFLTRSKTSSALNNEQLGNVGNNGDNMFPLIPKEMISVLEDAVPSIELALKPVLPEFANELIVNMISTWITSSRISSNNIHPMPTLIMTNKSKPVTLRSWASRSFSIKPKSVVVAPIPQKIEISDSNNKYNDRTPSFTNSESPSSFSITSAEDGQIENPSLYTPLLLDSAAPPTASVMDKPHPTSRLPVSLRSMIDLLDTPPLIPEDDEKSLSLIEETLTPLSSTFFYDNDHIQQPALDSPSSVIAASFTTASENNNESGIITAVSSSKDSKSVRRSLSTIFTQFGLSMKKVFKKNSRSSSISRLKNTLSVQHNLSAQQQLSPMNVISQKQSYSLLAFDEGEGVGEENQPLPYDRPEAKAYAAAFATFMSTGKVDKSLADIYGGKTANNGSSVSSIRSDCNQDNDNVQSTLLDNSLDMKKQQQSSVYWDGDTTQSQQFDQLLDDIWERSQEYQDYFAAEEEQLLGQSTASFSTNFNNHFKNNALWSPSVISGETKFNSAVRASRTEGNMNSFEDSVPFVCVGKQQHLDYFDNHMATVVTKRKSQQVTAKTLNIEDVKAYKRSTSAYSNIKDYDLNWQESFHVEQKSRDKVAKTLKSVSWAFYSIIKRNHNLNEFSCDAIFDENESTISDGSTYNYCSEPLTDWNDIYDQLAYVFDCGELTSEHAIITFIYVKRMLELSKQRLWDFSWRMITMSSLLTAVKVWDDCAIFNADFAMIFPELTLDVINNIERVFLTHLEWDVSVNCSDFARTYFHLRDIEHMMDQW